MACVAATEDTLRKVAAENIREEEHIKEGVSRITTEDGHTYVQKQVLPSTDAKLCHTIAHVVLSDRVVMEDAIPLTKYFKDLKYTAKITAMTQLSDFMTTVLACCIKEKIAMPDLKPDNVVVLRCNGEVTVPAQFRIIDLEDIGPLDGTSDTRTYSLREIESSPLIAQRRAARTVFGAACTVLLLPLRKNALLSSLRGKKGMYPHADHVLADITKAIPKKYKAVAWWRQAVDATVAALGDGRPVYDHPMLVKFPENLSLIEAIRHCKKEGLTRAWTTRDGHTCAVSNTITITSKNKERSVSFATDIEENQYLMVNEGGGFVVDGTPVVQARV